MGTRRVDCDALATVYIPTTTKASTIDAENLSSEVIDTIASRWKSFPADTAESFEKNSDPLDLLRLNER
ncbi:hypothetical protein PtA15_6A886 [Puccinia triticina]|uniref:HMG box domain-containing protein n=1 Tax=Puccinia triticina TaxID=208348 RepID=A0ABY7CM63_9BASI|nr:uncharacterized protein PtA15_6A886 [Puccinia triticina]WAQ86254.1 hypothetical protein PtA15_6A886 [Puccinia triticina]